MGTFDEKGGETPEFTPDSTVGNRRKDRDAAAQAATAAAKGRRAKKKVASKKRAANRNRGDQATHPVADHGPVHDENLDAAAHEAEDLDPDRESEVTDWVMPSTLESPPPRPGYVQRWIRIRLQDVRDNARLQKAMREGWRPVKASATHVAGYSLPSIRNDQLGQGDYIGAEDLLLMEMPERVARQRDAHFRKVQARQTGAILRQVTGVHSPDHEGFGEIRHRNRSRVAVGRPAEPMDDDL